MPCHCPLPAARPFSVFASPPPRPPPGQEGLRRHLSKQDVSHWQGGHSGTGLYAAPRQHQKGRHRKKKKGHRSGESRKTERSVKDGPQPQLPLLVCCSPRGRMSVSTYPSSGGREGGRDSSGVHGRYTPGVPTRYVCTAHPDLGPLSQSSRTRATCPKQLRATQAVG